MKRRLFWKILIGFWITFIAILEGLWLVFTLYGGTPRPLRQEEANARMQLTALSAVLESGGSDSLRTVLESWPAERRDVFAVRPASETETEKTGIIENGDKLQLATHDARGAAWQLSYDLAPARARFTPHGPLRLPPELLAAGAIGGLLFSTALAWYLTRPIQTLQSGFRRFAQGALGTRLQPEMGRRRDEIADLARDFDQMAARLQQLVAARDQLLHDVSHELRSPLARLQVAIDLARQNPQRLASTLDRVDAESRRLDELVGELLTLSRVENGAPDFDDYFDLGDLLRKVTADARFEAQASNVGIVANITEDEESTPALRGNAELMRRALENIVRNALHHSVGGQQVTVDLACDHAAGAFAVRIADQGPGVPAQALETMFEPFVRLQDGTSGKASNGFGLGLAIARRAVEAHGGSIRAENRQPRGLAVEIRLPFRNTESNPSHA